MRKELVFAILLGLGLGLIVTYGTYRARKSLLSVNTDNNITNTQSTSNTDVANEAISLISPIDESIQPNKEIKVTGTTKPNSLVIIFIQNQSQVIEADASGNFSVQGTLENGANVIVVRAIDEDGNVTEIERTVIMSNVNLDEVPGPTTSPTPSPSPKASPKATPKASPKVSPSPRATPKATP